MKWNPIETAPKDGSYILIHRANGHGMHLSPVVARWVEREIVGSKVKRTEGKWQIDDTGSAMLGKGTHWMPMPKGPEVA